MNSMPWKVPVITAASIVVSGLVWLAVYSLNVKASIGFDGAAWGMLAMTIFAGWAMGAVIALLFSRPLPKEKLSDSLFAILITGLVVSFATGLIISQYALSRYPDGGKYLQTVE
jgi:hypothetical protein